MNLVGMGTSVRSPSRAPDASRTKAMTRSQPLQLVHLMLQHYWVTSSKYEISLLLCVWLLLILQIAQNNHLLTLTHTVSHFPY